MAEISGERFKLIRRNSLHNEVDGAFEELEDFEDRNEGTNEVTHQECVLLNRVLSDKAKLPTACRAPSTTVQKASAQLKPMKPVEQGGGIGGVVRRLTGAVPEAFSNLVAPHEAKMELGGIVTEEQCQTLADYLAPSVGGLYLLPGACSHLLKTDDTELAEQYEKENAEVYARLKKRKTFVAKAGYPPTMC